MEKKQNEGFVYSSSTKHCLWGLERKGEIYPCPLVAMKAASSRKSKGVNPKKKSSTFNWPDISPKAALSPLFLKGSFLFTVPDFLTGAEAEAFVKLAESIGFQHQGSLGPAKGEAFRDNHRIAVESPLLAEKLWNSGLATFFHDVRVRNKVAIGLNPNIRLYRYTEGQRFGQHIDESVNLGGGKRTEYTLLIYLSGWPISKGKKVTCSNPSLVGGETVFYDDGQVVAEVKPIAGTALFHIHGAMCMLHEARVVTQGVKYVLRSDVVFS